MEQAPITIGDGQPPTPEPTPAPRRWPLLGGGIVAGLVLGALFGTAPPGPDTASDTEPTAAAEVAAPFSPTTTTTEVRGPDPLASRVPGFVDNLVSLAIDASGTNVAYVWRASDRNPAPRSLPQGEIQADPAHEWISTLTWNRYTSAGSLWVGNDAYMEPVATNVAKAVWRQGPVASLAWAEDGADGVTRLVEASFAPGSHAQPTVVTVLEGAEVPVWWTSEGIVLHDPAAGRLRLVGATGTVRGGLDGIDKFVTGGEDLAAVIRRGEPQLIDGALEVSGDAPWPDTCGAASFRPPDAGDRLIALACEPDARGNNTTLQIWSLPPEGAAELLHEQTGDGLVAPTWSPDGRLVVAAWIDSIRPTTRLSFVNPVRAEESSVAFPGTVLSVETIRAH